MEYQHDFFGVDMETKGQKWEMLTARATLEEKRDIFVHCKSVIKLPYSVITRIIWRRILSNYRTMPGLQRDATREIEQSVDEVLEYIPVIRRQRQYGARQL